MVLPVRPDPDVIIIEDDDVAVTYWPPIAWIKKFNPEVYSGQSFQYTTTKDASVSFTFNGSAVWLYADKNFDHGDYTVQLDNQPPVLVNGFSNPRQSMQAIYSSNLEPGTHTLNISNIAEDKYFVVDYFAVVPLPTPLPASSPSPSASPPTPSTSPDTQPTSSNPQTGAIIGIVFSAFTFLILLLIAFILYRNRSQSNKRARKVETRDYVRSVFSGPSRERLGVYSPVAGGQAPGVMPVGIAMEQWPSPGLAPYPFSRHTESYISVEPTRTDITPHRNSRFFWSDSTSPRTTRGPEKFEDAV